MAILLKFIPSHRWSWSWTCHYFFLGCACWSLLWFLHDMWVFVSEGVRVSSWDVVAWAWCGLRWSHGSWTHHGFFKWDVGVWVFCGLRALFGSWRCQGFLKCGCLSLVVWEGRSEVEGVTVSSWDVDFLSLVWFERVAWKFNASRWFERVAR